VPGSVGLTGKKKSGAGCPAPPRLPTGGGLLQNDQLVHVGVTAHPTAEWLSHQISEAFPWDRPPRHLIRDRDRAFGEVFKHRLHAMGIRDRPTAPRSPWQNAYAERLIGSIRRDCLDHLIIVDERHLHNLLRDYEQRCPVGPTRAEPWGAAAAASFRRPAPFIRADVVLGRDRIAPAAIGLEVQNKMAPTKWGHLLA
jgi:hypothetical protein